MKRLFKKAIKDGLIFSAIMEISNIWNKTKSPETGYGYIESFEELSKKKIIQVR